ncbi:1-deoxy-D-xylulose-5-phosphate reductoisomerase [uncultured Roseibium sp.]|uniref:1-deoxy-D-xylulose-5-phosphate reductoisomerase n=1 Tax=uncultured Roseibium sp. TaxID=1936171 RepID=UPI00374DF2E0
MDAAPSSPMDMEMNGTTNPMRLIVLGATGSIGKSTLDLVARNPERFKVTALVSNNSVDELARLARLVNAEAAVLANEAHGPALAQALSGSGIAVSAGNQAVLDAVDRPADMVVAGIVGAAGLVPTLAAIKPGRAIALANKECLVSAGDLFMKKIRRTGATLLPVDSEHNAIFQVFEPDNRREVEKIILTASGGPFRTTRVEDMAAITPEQALKHPNWEMGQRITIDSATLMNKGFEVIEAFHLFPVDDDQLGVLVHPQSVVHGLVQYADGSLLAQMGSPDMRTPIAHCLAWPKRMPVPLKRLDLAEVGSLTFEKPDPVRFPALGLALSSLKHGGGATCALNAADEIAVRAFLDRRLRFPDIPAAVEATINRLDASGRLGQPDSAETVMALDAEARVICADWITERGGR